MTLEALTGQLYIRNGEIQDVPEIPGLLAQPAPPGANRSRTQDYLFVHLSLGGPPEESAALAMDLVEAISDRFYDTSGSVTAALRKALLGANQLLFNYNLANPDYAREGAITLGAKRGYDLYMVQTGEALAYIGRNFGVERLPERLPDTTTPLGRAAGIDIRFFHNMLEPGDKVLLVDPRLAHLPSSVYEAALVELDVEGGLARLGELVIPGTGRLLLVEFSDDPLDDMPDTLSGSSRMAASRTEALTQPFRARRPELDIDLERSARRATAETARGLSHATGGIAAFLERLRPAPRTEFEERRTPIALPTLLVLLIPIIIGGVVTGVYLQRNIEQQMADKQEAIIQLVALAEAAESNAEALEYYRTARRLVDEAEQIKRGDADIQRLRTQVMEGIDRIEGNIRLATSLLYLHDDATDLQAVAIRAGHNGGIFALDAAGNNIYYYPTDASYRSMTTSEPELIFFGGESFGGHIVNTMLDLYWRPGGLNATQDGLAVLDLNSSSAQGGLMSYVPNFSQKNYVPLALSSEWGKPVAVTSYNERVYVLDQAANVVWRYFPDGASYVLQESDPTIAFLDSVDLSQAVDLDIYDQDANLILVYRDGRIEYYDSRTGRALWDQNTLELTPPLVAPAAVRVIGVGLNASIFVLDPGSDRLIQLSRAGTVLAQYRAAAVDGLELFGRASDFDVVENPLRVITASDNALYVATLSE